MDETRATDARYSIVHDGGTTEVTRNQRAGGGFWQYLGSYSFDPLLNPTVTLAANDNGSVAADAVRFVGGPAGAADVAYLHTDHLGTPQAMTDAGAQLLWWRDQTPFGQMVDAGGFSQTPIRFPGQFADDESGLHYNYFRDYDPALGRYIQSDPIGLRGGLNTYAYADSNPIMRIDPTGELGFLLLAPALAGGGGAAAGGTAAAGGVSWGTVVLGALGLGVLMTGDTPQSVAVAAADRPWRKNRARWKVYTRCNVSKRPDCVNCPDTKGGWAYGKTFDLAVKAAQEDAGDNLGAMGARGCQARHCDPIVCFENGKKVHCPRGRPSGR